MFKVTGAARFYRIVLVVTVGLVLSLEGQRKWATPHDCVANHELVEEVANEQADKPKKEQDERVSCGFLSCDNGGYQYTDEGSG